MKLSTRIIKYGNPCGIRYCGKDGDITDRPIVFMVDLERRHSTHDLRDADQYHKQLLAGGCTLLPLNECPVFNGQEVIMHYTSTTYAKWCNLGVN